MKAVHFVFKGSWAFVLMVQRFGLGLTVWGLA